MYNKQDLIIGAVDNLKWDKIRNFVMSVKQSGFLGRKIILAYRIDAETVKTISENGFEVVQTNVDTFGQPINHTKNGKITQVLIQRYLDTYRLLNEIGKDYRYAIVSDVTDVVFQSNPSDWLDNDLHPFEQLLAQSEGIQFKNEAWNANCTANGLGLDAWEILQNKLIYNAGIITGTPDLVKEICLLNYYISVGHDKADVATPDQSAYNLLINTTYQHLTKFIPMSKGWCAMCATTMEESKRNLRVHLAEPLIEMHDDGFVYTSEGKKFVLVHQYNRIPEWNDTINKRFQ